MCTIMTVTNTQKLMSRSTIKNYCNKWKNTNSITVNNNNNYNNNNNNYILILSNKMQK